MTALRKLTARPELVVAGNGGLVVDPAANQIGQGAIFSARMLTVLPTNSGPVQLVAPVVVQGTDLSYLGDPDGNLIGSAGVQVSRMLLATKAEDTRRL